MIDRVIFVTAMMAGSLANAAPIDPADIELRLFISTAESYNVRLGDTIQINFSTPDDLLQFDFNEDGYRITQLKDFNYRRFRYSGWSGGFDVSAYYVGADPKPNDFAVDISYEEVARSGFDEYYSRSRELSNNYYFPVPSIFVGFEFQDNNFIPAGSYVETDIRYFSETPIPVPGVLLLSALCVLGAIRRHNRPADA